MRELRTFREVARREARRALGVQPLLARIQQAQIDAQFDEASILRLPEDVASLEEIQLADGSFYFMAGFSRVGGPDPVK